MFFLDFPLVLFFLGALGLGTDWLFLEYRFCLGQGGGFDEWTRPPYKGLLPDAQYSVHLPKTPKGFCPVVD